MKMIVITIFIFCSLISNGQNNPNAILGQWITEKENCIVEVYKVKD